MGAEQNINGFRLKPISKRALLECVNNAMYGEWRDRVLELLKKKDFSSVRLKPGPGNFGFSNQEALVSWETVEEYTSYCGNSVYAAIIALVGKELDIGTLHMLSFHNTITIPPVTPPYTEEPPETGNTPSDEAQ